MVERYERVRKGIGSLYLAEVLALISAVMSGLVTVLHESDETTVVLLLTVLSVIGFILSGLSFILNMIALVRMHKSAPFLMSGFVLSLIGLLIAGGAGALSVWKAGSSNGIVVSALANTLAGILEAFVVIFVCVGFSAMMHELEEKKVARKGSVTALVVAILYSFGKVGALSIASIKDISDIKPAATVIAAIVSMLMQVVGLIFYLGFLGKVRNTATLGSRPPVEVVAMQPETGWADGYKPAGMYPPVTAGAGDYHAPAAYLPEDTISEDMYPYEGTYGTQGEAGAADGDSEYGDSAYGDSKYGNSAYEDSAYEDSDYGDFAYGAQDEVSTAPGDTLYRTKGEGGTAPGDTLYRPKGGGSTVTEESTERIKKRGFFKRRGDAGMEEKEKDFTGWE